MIPVRRLGVENWKPEDFEREKVWRSECELVAKERKRILSTLGWEFRTERCYHDGHCSYGEWAFAPGSTERMTIQEAYAFIKADHPDKGLLPEFPPRPEFPSSTFGLFEIGETRIQPMEMPKGLLFYMDFEKKDDDQQF
jgi:hypothetical protein